ncbi:MAG: LuxR C-terminal-related transcriptional regulator [Actinomycetota bacterium]|nr:LuxR C-terminal-related transcriptional regulator [Actinomycetota bacterium]
MALTRDRIVPISKDVPDRVERLTLLAQSLVRTPKWDELTRLLALRIFDSWSCETVMLFTVKAHGSLTLTSCYGVADADVVNEIVLSDYSALSNVLSKGGISWGESGTRLGRLIPKSLHPSVPGAVIIAPLNRVTIPEQVLVLTFAQPLPDNPASMPFVSAVVSLLELRIAMMGSTDMRRGTDGQGEEEGGLSDRQMLVLQGIRNGKTNRAIAEDLGFSESTIRQETLRIYQALGVNSRTDAVTVAREEGLLTN